MTTTYRSVLMQVFKENEQYPLSIGQINVEFYLKIPAYVGGRKIVNTDTIKRELRKMCAEYIIQRDKEGLYSLIDHTKELPTRTWWRENLHNIVAYAVIIVLAIFTLWLMADVLTNIQ